MYNVVSASYKYTHECMHVNTSYVPFDIVQ